MTDEPVTSKTLRDATTPTIDTDSPNHRWGEAEYASRGRVYGGIAAGNGQLGASMSEREVRDLVASFDKLGKKADCIEALEGSGVTVPVDLKK